MLRDGKVRMQELQTKSLDEVETVVGSLPVLRRTVWREGAGVVGSEWREGVGGSEWREGVGGSELREGVEGSELRNGVGGSELRNGVGGSELR